jgi:hypothetical protein
MYWVPRRLDIDRIVQIAEQLHSSRDNNLPLIGEFGGGTGLLGYLLASTGRVRVLVTDPDRRGIEKGFYRHENLEYFPVDALGASQIFQDKKVDLVLNSWMPEGVNLTPAIRSVGASGILYVKDSSGSTGVLRPPRGTDHDDRAAWVSYEPGSQYRNVLKWDGFDRVEAQGLLSGRTATRIRSADFLLQTRHDTPSVALDTGSKTSERYRWEQELRDQIIVLGEQFRLQGNRVEYFRKARG